MAAVGRVFILGYGQISNSGRPYCFHQVKEMKWREKGNEYNEVIFAMLQRTQLCRSTGPRNFVCMRDQIPEMSVSEPGGVTGCTLRYTPRFRPGEYFPQRMLGFQIPVPRTGS